MNEFEVYWQYLTARLMAISSLDPPDMVTEVVIASAPDSGVPLRLAGDARGIMHVADTPRSSGPWTAQRAIYVPLEPGTVVVPPRSDQPFWTLDDIRALLAHCSERNRARHASMIGVIVFFPGKYTLSPKWHFTAS